MGFASSYFGQFSISHVIHRQQRQFSQGGAKFLCCRRRQKALRFETWRLSFRRPKWQRLVSEPNRKSCDKNWGFSFIMSCGLSPRFDDIWYLEKNFVKSTFLCYLFVYIFCGMTQPKTKSSPNLGPWKTIIMGPLPNDQLVENVTILVFEQFISIWEMNHLQNSNKIEILFR